MVQLVPHANGTLLTVRARAGGHKNAVTGKRQGALLVSVTQPAEKSKANLAIIALLAKLFGCGKRQIELVRGATSPTKLFLLIGTSPSQAERCVKNALSD